MSYGDDVALLAGETDRHESAAGAAAPYVMLSELLANPALLQPPPVVVPRLAWEGRLTLFASEEKKGKSTLAGQAVAALSTESLFLGESAAARPVLWACLDEPKEDAVRRFHRLGARDGVALLLERPGLLPLRRTIEELGAGLLVVDTLTEWAVDEVADFNAAEGWTRTLRGLRQVAQDTSCAMLLLHHVNRGNGKYRGSGQIGAGVDAVIEMTEDPEDATVRILKSRGRVVSEMFKLRWDGKGGYRLEGPPPSLEERVLAAVVSSPDVSQTGLRKAVGGKARDVDAAIDRLLEKGLIQDVGSKTARKYRPAESGQGQLDVGQG